MLINNRKRKVITVIAVLIFVGSLISRFTMQPDTEHPRRETIEYNSYIEFQKMLEEGEVETIYYAENYEDVFFVLKDGTYRGTSNPQYDDFKKDLLNYDTVVRPMMELQFAENVETKQRDYYTSAAVITVLVYLSIFYYWYAKSKVTAGTEVGGSDSSSYSGQETGKHFSDVAGLNEVKKDLKSIVDFLVNKDKYAKAGAKLPKGVILYGPPGTGKTLLAKAIAGEANVPFIYASGSDFIEKYVGVGAQRVRDLFNKARKKSPCIIFIDEIDSIGGQRGQDDSSGEDRKTINALLTEMDGFKETENVIVIGATNRLEDLDSALVRPGRFTDKFCVPLPETSAERLEVIKIYAKDKCLGDDVDLSALAHETAGFSPAQIEALLNEAAIVSVQSGVGYINRKVLDEAMYKMLMQGHIKEDQGERDKAEIEVVAWHEAGHALLGKHFGNEISKVTILSSTSGAGGVTFSIPAKTRLLSYEDMRHNVMELYGGRAAEEIFNGQTSVGASNDIERATAIIHEMIVKYGMSKEFGLLNLERAGFGKEYIVEKEVELSKQLYEEAYEILQSHYDQLKRIAEQLIEQNTIYEKDLDEIVNS